MVDRLVPYLRGGKTRNDLVGLRPTFAQSLADLVEQAPPDVRSLLGIRSAYRSNERQAELFSAEVAKRGSEAAARKWVAPPGRSKHNHGDAVDLDFGAPKGTPKYELARKYAHDNAAKYGLNFPMAHEAWHIEPIGARGAAAKVLPAAAGGPAAGPAAPGGAPVPSLAGQPLPAATVQPDEASGSDLAGILTAAIGAFGAKGAQNTPSGAMMQLPQPEMTSKKPNLAAILSGQSAPLLIGRPVA